VVVIPAKAGAQACGSIIQGLKYWFSA